MKKFKKIFPPKAVIGMIHVHALPGTPKYRGKFGDVIDKAIEEALIYRSGGVDAIILENMHDVPYLNRTAGPEITAAMGIIGYELRMKTGLPCGMQILAGANKEALAASNAAGLNFIRAEGFVFSHIADEGLMNSDAGELLRYRKQIDAENIMIFTDIKKKHSSHQLTADVTLVETAEAAEFFLSDGLIITGSKTGSAADPEEVNRVKEKVKVPVLIGSGITIDNIEKYILSADAFIIGSYFKKKGMWSNELDKTKIQNFMKKIIALRSQFK